MMQQKGARLPEMALALFTPSATTEVVHCRSPHSSSRPYKHDWEAGSAVEEIVSLSGVHFDPECVSAFLNGLDGILAIHEQYRGGSSQRPSAQLYL